MQRRKLAREFKLEAVGLILERGVAVAQAERSASGGNQAQSRRPLAPLAFTVLTAGRKRKKLPKGSSLQVFDKLTVVGCGGRI